MPAVTPAEIAKVGGDFAALLNDVTAMLPPSPQLSMAIMLFNVAEVAVMTLMQQQAQTTP